VATWHSWPPRARASTWLAAAYNLRVSFEVMGKELAAVRRADVFAFLSAQRPPRRGESVIGWKTASRG
jgi:integrase/recombinase XerD